MRSSFWTLTGVLIVALTISCSKDEDSFFQNPCYDEDLGEIYLAPSSISSLPYSNEDFLIFEDTAREEWVLKFAPPGGSQGLANAGTSGPCTSDSNRMVDYFFQPEFYAFSLKDSSGGSEATMFSFDLHIRMLRPEFIPYDALTVFKYLGNNGSGSISMLIDSREIPKEELKVAFDQPVLTFTIHGKTYSDVYISSGLNTVYNAEKGLVAFRDSTGKMWTLKE